MTCAFAELGPGMSGDTLLAAADETLLALKGRVARQRRSSRFTCSRRSSGSRRNA